MEVQDKISDSTRANSLTSFRFEQCIFEIRHPFAFYHWDRAGAIWTEFSRKWPNLEPIQAEPAITQFSLNKRFTLYTSTDKLGVIDLQPTKSDDGIYKRVLKEFVEIVLYKLEISQLSRVANRHIYFKIYKDQVSAAQAFEAAQLVTIPQITNFGIENPTILPECNIRWENDKIGATMRLRIESRSQVFDPPPGNQFFQRQEQKEIGLVFDVDYYTIAPMPVGQLDTALWVDQATHTIQRDGRKILGAVQ